MALRFFEPMTVPVPARPAHRHPSFLMMEKFDPGLGSRSNHAESGFPAFGVFAAEFGFNRRLSFKGVFCPAR